MKRRMKLITAALVASLFGGAAVADDWAGFYVALDAHDGSIGYLSLAPDGDGTYDLRIKSSHFRSCPAAHPAAVLLGTAEVEGDALAVDEGVRDCGDGVTEPATGQFDLKRGSGHLQLSLRSSPGPSVRFVKLAEVASDDDWAGVYIGIDAGDGSLNRMIILPGEDGNYRIVQKSSQYASCEETHPSAVTTADGRVVGEALRRENTQRRCTDTGDLKPAGEVELERIPGTGVVRYSGSSDGRPMIYHRFGG